MCQDRFKQPAVDLAADLDEKILNLDRTMDCFNKIRSDPLLELKLPSRNSRSGQVVKHAIEVVQRTLERQGPMVYKCGFTHCPFSRFRNRKYGYAVDKYQKWEKMIILYASHESVGPAFLEGCLIQKFKGNSNVICIFYKVFFL